MISVIISSYNDAFFDSAEQNIKATIGKTHEIIRIKNPGLYSLSEAYNKGASRAKFQILCFVHEDVLFHTFNWGQNLINHFKLVDDLGLIGLIGNVYKSSKPTSWNTQNKDKNKGYCLMRFTNGVATNRLIRIVDNLEFVKVVDGVFLATPKSVWAQNRFDESIRGFHLYDIDFSLRISVKHKVAVANDILLEHFSFGNFDEDWVKASIEYHSRRDKKILFTDDGQKLDSTFYIKSLTGFAITLKTKIAYLKNLGFGFKDLPSVVYFLFPEKLRIFIKNVKQVTGLNQK